MRCEKCDSRKIYVFGAVVVRRRRRTVIKVSAGCASCGRAMVYTKSNERVTNG